MAIDWTLESETYLVLERMRTVSRWDELFVLLAGDIFARETSKDDWHGETVESHAAMSVTRAGALVAECKRHLDARSKMPAAKQSPAPKE